MTEDEMKDKIKIVRCTNSFKGTITEDRLLRLEIEPENALEIYDKLYVVSTGETIEAVITETSSTNDELHVSLKITGTESGCRCLPGTVIVRNIEQQKLKPFIQSALIYLGKTVYGINRYEILPVTEQTRVDEEAIIAKGLADIKKRKDAQAFLKTTPRDMADKEEKEWFGDDCDKSIKVGEYEKPIKATALEQLHELGGSTEKEVKLPDAARQVVPEKKVDAQVLRDVEKEMAKACREDVKKLLPDLDKIKADAAKQVLPEVKPLPDLKEQSEIYNSPLPADTTTVFAKKERADYQKDMNVDTTDLNYLFGFYTYKAIQSIIKEILSDRSGYPQSDKTYALYPHFVNLIKKYDETDFDALTRQEQSPFLRTGERALLSFMSHLWEK